ncbi:MAG: DNA polymerase III subunit epsilon [Rubrivivax sp.]|nr:DNA polymerase III subunit epsilon [Rubrivivax sp.]
MTAHAPDGAAAAGRQAPPPNLASGAREQARREGSPALAVAAGSLAVIGWTVLWIALLWADLGETERPAAAALLRPRAGLLMLLGLAVPLLVWAGVAYWWARWPAAARRLRDEVTIAATANAGHRIAPAGSAGMRRLAEAIDTLAQAHAQSAGELEARVAQAQAALGDQTQRLAALMSQLTFGVLVCNREGRILLYNGRAVELLAGAATAPGTAAADAGMAVGLGRPVQALLDPGALEQAWRQLQRRWQAGEPPGTAQFAARPSEARATDVAGRNGTTGNGGVAASRGHLLHVQMAPTLGAGGAPAGYVLLLDDVTRHVYERGQRETLLHQLTEGLRGTLASLRAALHALQHYPAMAAPRRQQLVATAHDQAEELARQLGEATRGGEGHAGRGWPMEEVRAIDIADSLQQRLRTEAAVECRFDGGATCDDGNGGDVRLRVDSHGLVQLLATCAQRLVQEAGAHDLALTVEAADLRWDLVWSGGALPAGRIEGWEAAVLPGPGGAGATTLRELLDRHGAELWTPAFPAGGTAAGSRQRLCLQLGAMCRAAPPSSPAVPAANRPIAYDFDLFHQGGQSVALDHTPLSALHFTVFDTETTGLRPSEGDEIIAIGAVRIVNARLLEPERFERRVRPRRAVRASAEAVHGISTAALAGEPPLEQVLPAFARFCAETVLVAHNAAFDMRFLELAHERTGVRFDQPVLDTMLLSAVAQPGLGSHEHHLEEVAARLGVAVEGRHQALGDALTTGRVLLKLLPLLAERGIRTLADARRASQQVAIAEREKY